MFNAREGKHVNFFLWLIMKPSFQIWLTGDRSCCSEYDPHTRVLLFWIQPTVWATKRWVVLNVISTKWIQLQQSKQCYFFIHKKPFTRNVFQINAQLYSMGTIMAQNVMKQTRLIKTITGILLRHTALAYAAVLFETCLKKRLTAIKPTPAPFTSRNKYVCILCVDELWDMLWLLDIT